MSSFWRALCLSIDFQTHTQLRGMVGGRGVPLCRIYLGSSQASDKPLPRGAMKRVPTHFFVLFWSTVQPGMYKQSVC